MKNYKLEKLKKEQKEKAKPNIKFDNYLKQTKTTEDKVVLLKLKKKSDASLFLSSFKNLMKK